MDPFSPPGHGSTSTVTLSSFLDRFPDLLDESDGYVVHCPAHSDSVPSLRVAYNSEARKLALKCRAGCSVPDVVAALDLAMSDLFNVAPGANIVARSIARDLNAPSIADRAALAQYLARAATALSPEALAYVDRRFGLSPDKARDLALGFDDGTLDGGKLILSRSRYHDAPRLVVPFLDFAGHPHYLQARDLANTAAAKWSGPMNPEGAAWGKYGFLPGGTGWAEVIVTEGPGDALTAVAVGYDALLIRGASLFNDNPTLADEVAAALRGRTVIVAGDDDTAGQRFTRQVCAALSDRDVDARRLTLPDGVGDLSKWQETAGAAFARAFVVAVKAAPRYGSDQIVAEEVAHDLTRLFSDVYNARALLAGIHDSGADVRFTPEVGFVVYDPAGVWRIDAADWVRSQAQDVAPRIQRLLLRAMQEMDARVAAITDQALREEVGKLLDRQRAKVRNASLVSYVMSTRGIDSMLRELRALPGVFASYEDFDQHPHLLAVANGVVNLETGELRPYTGETKELYLMRQVTTPYHPGARNPRWEQFVGEIFANHDGLPEYMQRLTGYGITGHTTEQALAVCFGGGSNGKGVLLETLTGIFKGVTTTTPFSTFEVKPSGGIPNDIAALKGSRLVMASEGEQGRPMAESLIKRLTGGDTISARFMRQEYFDFVPTFLIILATNYRPNFRGQDFGLWRRVKLIPFDRTFTAADRDPYLTSKFLGKRVPASAYRDGEDHGDGPAGILAWAVSGAMSWAADGLNPPAVITAATERFKESSDKLAEFYAHYLVKDARGRIPGKEVWALYQEWTDEENLPQKERWTRSTFWSALEERGAAKHADPKKGVTFHGVRKRRPHEIGAIDSADSVAEPDALADIPNDGAPDLREFVL